MLAPYFLVIFIGWWGGGLAVSSVPMFDLKSCMAAGELMYQNHSVTNGRLETYCVKSGS